MILVHAKTQILSTHKNSVLQYRILAIYLKEDIFLPLASKNSSSLSSFIFSKLVQLRRELEEGLPAGSDKQTDMDTGTGHTLGGDN